MSPDLEGRIATPLGPSNSDLGIIVSAPAGIYCLEMPQCSSQGQRWYIPGVEAHAWAWHKGELFRADNRGIFELLTNRQVDRFSRLISTDIPPEYSRLLPKQTWWRKSLNGSQVIDLLDTRVNCFAGHDGGLYHGGMTEANLGYSRNHKPPLVKFGGSVHQTVPAQRLAHRPSEVYAMVSHDGVLYDAGEYGVFDTKRNAQLSSDPVKQFLSKNDVLYTVGHFDVMVLATPESSGTEVFRVSGEHILLGMYQFGDTLLTHGLNMVSSQGLVWDTETGDSTAKRSGRVRTMFSDRGRLYDCSDILGGKFPAAGIYRTFDPANRPIWRFDDIIERAIAVPMDMWEKLAVQGRKEI